MFCRDHSLIANSILGGKALPLRCRAWSCDQCGPERARQLIAIGIAGNPNRFITLTSRRKPGVQADVAAQQLSTAWKTTLKRYRRQHPNAAPAYLCVFEATKQGWPHLHILWRGPWIDQKWLSDTMNELTKSPVVSVEYINNKKRAAAYVAKYCGKAPHRFAHLKRYWCSKNWQSKSGTDAAKAFHKSTNLERVDRTLQEQHRIWLVEKWAVRWKTPNYLAWGQDEDLWKPVPDYAEVNRRARPG